MKPEYRVLQTYASKMVDIAIANHSAGRFCWHYLYGKRNDDGTHSTGVASEFANGDCGTTACIIGGALLDPYFASKGLPSYYKEWGGVATWVDIEDITYVLHPGISQEAELLYRRIYYQDHAIKMLMFFGVMPAKLNDRHMLEELKDLLDNKFVAVLEYLGLYNYNDFG